MNHAQKGQRRKDGKKERGRRNEALSTARQLEKDSSGRPQMVSYRGEEERNGE
jgi:hypothetical protein